MPQSNILSAPAEEIGALFCDYLDGNTEGAVMVMSEKALGGAAREAIGKTLDSFGYGAEAALYATLYPLCPEAEGGDIPLDSQALFLMVEGLDPVCVICADAAAASAVAQAYRVPCDVDSAVRVFGRPGVAFGDFSALLATEAGKQRAWRLLKTLPKRQ